MTDDDPYVYPGTKILRNKLGLKTSAALDKFERMATANRAAEGLPKGDFDLPHLQAIHHHLFQDVFDWAGQVRTVEIKKDGHQFMFRQFIENGMADVHRRVVTAGYFKETRRAAFAEEAGRILGDVNYVHPFREGNGRTQLLYLKQLSVSAGHTLDLRAIDAEAWLEASRRSHDTDYKPMSLTIRAALERSARARDLGAVPNQSPKARIDEVIPSSAGTDASDPVGGLQPSGRPPRGSGGRGR